MKTLITLTLKFSLTFVLFYFVIIKYVDGDLLLDALFKINLWFFFIIIIIQFITRILQAHQTNICFLPYNMHFNLWETFKVQLVSSFYSLTLPGDLVAGGITWHLMSRDTGHRAQVASVIAYLRLLNLVTLIPFAILGLFIEPSLLQINAHIFLTVVSVLLILPITPFVWKPAADFCEMIFSPITNRLPWERVRLAFSNLWMSIRICNTMPMRLMIQIIVLSFLMQLFGILLFWLCILSINITIPASTILWLRAVIIIIQTLPLTISGLGVREFTVITLLERLYNIDNESAFLLSILLFFVMVFFGGLLGGFFAITLKKKTDGVIEKKI